MTSNTTAQRKEAPAPVRTPAPAPPKRVTQQQQQVRTRDEWPEHIRALHVSSNLSDL